MAQLLCIGAGHVGLPLSLKFWDVGHHVDVRLAETGQCLILHRSDPGGDTYLVNDAGTVYRYQVKPSNVVWGEWKPATPVALSDGDLVETPDDAGAESSSA